MKQMATGSKAPEALLSHDWLGACRRAAEGLQAVLRENPTSAERVVETGERGGGGDLTLVIDAAAEDAGFSELDPPHAARARSPPPPGTRSSPSSPASMPPARASRRSPRSAGSSTTATPTCSSSSTRSTA